MPKMDGWQVCKEIRAFSEVPIIMLTAKGDERDELPGFELGGVAQLAAKLFDMCIDRSRISKIIIIPYIIKNFFP